MQYNCTSLSTLSLCLGDKITLPLSFRVSLNFESLEEEIQIALIKLEAEIKLTLIRNNVKTQLK